MGKDSISVNYSKLPGVCWDLPLLNVYCNCDYLSFEVWLALFRTGGYLGASFWGVRAGVQDWRSQGRAVLGTGWWSPSVRWERFIKNHDNRLCKTFSFCSTFWALSREIPLHQISVNLKSNVKHCYKSRCWRDFNWHLSSWQWAGYSWIKYACGLWQKGWRSHSIHSLCLSSH